MKHFFPDVTFGFDRAQYNVVESASFVNVTIRQVGGAILNRNVLITLTSVDATAICTLHRCIAITISSLE